MHLVPPNGRRYHLFNASVLMIGISLLWYITTDVSETTRAALDETLFGRLQSPRGWGFAMVGVGCFGIIAASWRRRPRLFDWGYMAVTLMCALWCLTLFLGSTVAQFLGASSWETTGKAYGSALWFGYLTRDLVAALMRRGTVDEAERPEVE